MKTIFSRNTVIVPCFRSDIDNTALVPLAEGWAGYPDGAGEAFELVSSSISDDIAGVGARKVKHVFLDTSGEIQVETIDLAGTTPVVSATLTYWRTLSLSVIEYGTTKENVGAITLAKVSAGGNRGKIIARRKSFLPGQFTVPVGRFARLNSLSLTAGVATAALLDTQIEIEMDPETGAYTPDVWTVVAAFRFDADAYMDLRGVLDGVQIPELATIRVMAIGDSASALGCAGFMNIGLS